MVQITKPLYLRNSCLTLSLFSSLVGILKLETVELKCKQIECKSIRACSMSFQIPSFLACFALRLLVFVAFQTSVWPNDVHLLISKTLESRKMELKPMENSQQICTVHLAQSHALRMLIELKLEPRKSHLYGKEAYARYKCFIQNRANERQVNERIELNEIWLWTRWSVRASEKQFDCNVKLYTNKCFARFNLQTFLIKELQLFDILTLCHSHCAHRKHSTFWTLI